MKSSPALKETFKNAELTLNFKFKKYSFSNNHSSVIFLYSFLAEIIKLGEVALKAFVVGLSFRLPGKLPGPSVAGVRLRPRLGPSIALPRCSHTILIIFAISSPFFLYLCTTCTYSLNIFLFHTFEVFLSKCIYF